MSDVRDDEGVPELPARVRGPLGRPETWAVPSPGLEDDVLAALRRERDAAPGTPTGLSSLAPAEDAPPRAPGPPDDLTDARRRRPTQRGWRRGRALVAAAAVVAALAGGAFVVVRDRAPETVVALAPTELAPGASGRAEIRSTPSGFAIELDVDGLPPAPEGSYYQAWLRNGAGDLVTIGTFHGRGGSEDVVLWSGVDPRDYPTLTVTLQREDAGAASSGRVVLRGTTS